MEQGFDTDRIGGNNHEENYGTGSSDLLSFYGCTALRQINIPSTVKTIESRAFAECSPELVVNLPSGLVQTDDGSYRRTSNLSFTGTYKYSRAYEILNFTNQERAKVGAAPLTMDPDLLFADESNYRDYLSENAQAA